MANKPLPPGTKLGDYTLVRRISNGGQGMVYLARTKTGLPVVIKEYLPQHLNLRTQGERVHMFNSNEYGVFEAGMKDFFAENEILTKIKHPNVVQVIDSFKLNNTAYSVMEYIYGQSLQQVIRSSEGGIRESFIRKVFLDVLSGLAYLHDNRILHLDIKPSNIYVTHQGKAMLLDFGTAWLLDFEDSLDKKKKPPMHTPGFAPPEQHKQYYSPTRIGTHTDLYALGASLRACVSGRPPQTSINRIESGNWRDAQQQWMGYYSPWLLEWIDGLTTLEWDKRPKNAMEVWHSFDKAIPLNHENSIRAHLYKLISRTHAIHD